MLMLIGPWALTACSQTPLSALDPAGPQAGHVARVWHAMAWGSALILLFMLVLAMIAIGRKETPPSRTRNNVLLWGGGVAFPLVVMIALLVYGHYPGGSVLQLELRQPFRVQVHAHQWWWEVRYLDPKLETGEHYVLYSANELHVPVNRPVQIELTANDVIHSFWAPRLGGKMDAIPGRTNRLKLFVDEPGIYQGVCAEFCGEQHARMQFRVVAHTDGDLAKRLSVLERSGLMQVQAVDKQAAVGRSIFMARCAACHSVDPRQAGAGAPNLADLPWRLTLGAGVLDNDNQGLRIWLRSHALIKPGNHMPVLNLEENEISQLASYLTAERSRDE